MTLLSLGAAYGVIVVVFQWGWGMDLIGLESTVPVIPFIPMFMFAVLFGLSMDYEVFLMSRIREEYVRTGDSDSAVIRGIARLGPSDHVRRPHHDLRLPRLRTRRGSGHEDDGTGPGHGHLRRRDDCPHGAGPCSDEDHGQGELVAAPGWLDRLLPAVDIDGAKDRHATREDAMVGAAPRDTTSA